MQLQRTILWIVFSMSLLFLWDNWQRHSGKPSMFGGAAPTPRPPARRRPSGAAGRWQHPGRRPAASVPASGGGDRGRGARAVAPSGTAREQRARRRRRRRRDDAAVRNDVLALDIDPVGGQIRRAELLKHKAVATLDKTDDSSVVLLEDQPGKVYWRRAA